MKKLAVSLVEVLIAIMIFGVGILGISQMLITNIQTLDNLKIQNRGMSLAKEGIELLINYRNTNLLMESTRNCLAYDEQLNCIEKLLSTGVNHKNFLISIDPINSYVIKNIELDDEKFDEKFKNTRLFFTDNKNAGRLQNNETLYPSDFARYIKITEATNTTTGNIASPDLLIKIESHVLYKRSGKTGEIILESLMGKIR